MCVGKRRASVRGRRSSAGEAVRERRCWRMEGEGEDARQAKGKVKDSKMREKEPPRESGGDAAVSSALAELVCRGDEERREATAAIPNSQQQTAKSLNAAAAMMSESSAAAKSQLARSASTFSRAVAVMKELRTDLDYIHRHCSSLKKFIMEKYPETRDTFASRKEEIG